MAKLTQDPPSLWVIKEEKTIGNPEGLYNSVNYEHEPSRWTSHILWATVSVYIMQRAV
jgi:hypothetical protein